MNDESVEAFGKPAFMFYWKVKGFFTVSDLVKTVICWAGNVTFLFLVHVCTGVYSSVFVYLRNSTR